MMSDVYKNLVNSCLENANKYLSILPNDVANQVNQEIYKHSNIKKLTFYRTTDKKYYDYQYSDDQRSLISWSDNLQDIPMHSKTLTTHNINSLIGIHHDALKANRYIDSQSIGTLIPKLARFQDYNLLYGDGQSKYQGILSDISKIKTIEYDNLLSVLSSFPHKYHSGAVWILSTKFFTKLANSNKAVDYFAKDYSMLLGLPVILTDLLDDGHQGLLINLKETMIVIDSNFIQLSKTTGGISYTNFIMMINTGNYIKNYDSCLLIT